MVEISWHSQTKERATENTNINLHRRASPRPYLRGQHTRVTVCAVTYSCDIAMPQPRPGTAHRNTFAAACMVRMSLQWG